MNVGAKTCGSDETHQVTLPSSREFPSRPQVLQMEQIGRRLTMYAAVTFLHRRAPGAIPRPASHGPRWPAAAAAAALVHRARPPRPQRRLLSWAEPESDAIAPVVTTASRRRWRSCAWRGRMARRRPVVGYLHFLRKPNGCSSMSCLTCTVVHMIL